MEAQLIQAMGSLSLADKARARASKAYGAMTEDQKEERRAKQAAAAKAKRAADKEKPKAEVPAEVVDAKKEKERLRKQKARAAAKGAGAEPEPKPTPKLNYPDPYVPPEGWARLDEGSDMYWVQLSTGFLRKPDYVLRDSTYRFYDVMIGERTYAVDLETGTVYAEKTRQSGDDVTVGRPVGQWGSGIFVLSNIPEEEQDVEDVRLTFADKLDEWKANEEARAIREREQIQSRKQLEERRKAEAEAEVKRRAEAEQKKREAEARKKEGMREEAEMRKMYAEDPFTHREEAALAETYASLFPSLLTIPRAPVVRPDRMKALSGHSVQAYAHEMGLYPPRTKFGHLPDAVYTPLRNYINGMTDEQYASRSIGEHIRAFLRPLVAEDVPRKEARKQAALAEAAAKQAAIDAEQEKVPNDDWGFNPTFRKYFNEIAKEMNQPTPTKATMKEMMDYARSFSRYKWGLKPLKDHYRAFFSQKSK